MELEDQNAAKDEVIQELQEEIASTRSLWFVGNRFGLQRPVTDRKSAQKEIRFVASSLETSTVQ